MSFLKNKKGSIVVLEETSSQIQKMDYSDEQVIFVNSKKVKIIFNKPEYKINIKEK